jgi:hypothetical protein
MCLLACNLPLTLLAGVSCACLQLFFHDPDRNMIEICDCDVLPVIPLNTCAAVSMQCASCTACPKPPLPVTAEELPCASAACGASSVDEDGGSSSCGSSTVGECSRSSSDTTCGSGLDTPGEPSFSGRRTPVGGGEGTACCHGSAGSTQQLLGCDDMCAPPCDCDSGCESALHLAAALSMHHVSICQAEHAAGRAC